MKAELFVPSKCILGESPCWSSCGQILYWLDIHQKQLHQYKIKTQSHVIISLNISATCVVEKKDKGLAFAAQDGFYSFDLETKKCFLLCDPERNLPSNRFNDGKCDPKGRFLAGTMNMENPPLSEAGSLYSFHEGKATQIYNNLTLPNGMAWSPDGKIFYLIDSAKGSVLQFEYDLSTGIPKNPVPIIQITQGFPDGMTCDQEGMLWIAHWAGGQVTRWNPKTQKCLQIIPIPAPNVTSCTFGGPNMKDLFITTARKDMDKNALEKYPQAGGVFRLQTQTKG